MNTWRTSFHRHAQNPHFWPKVGLFFGGVHAILVGILLALREWYYGILGLELPHPRLYGDMAAWFLIVIGTWLIWSSLKMPQARELWIIPIGSAVGRMVYFVMALVGWALGITHVIYLYLSFTDVFFAIVQSWAVIRLRFTKDHGDIGSREGEKQLQGAKAIPPSSEELTPSPS